MTNQHEPSETDLTVLQSSLQTLVELFDKPTYFADDMSETWLQRRAAAYGRWAAVTKFLAGRDNEPIFDAVREFTTAAADVALQRENHGYANHPTPRVLDEHLMELLTGISKAVARSEPRPRDVDELSDMVGLVSRSIQLASDDENNERIRAAVESATQEQQERIESLRTEAEAAKNDFRRLQREQQIATGVDGTEGLYSDFLELHEDERKAANLYRKWTIVTLAVTIGLALIFLAGEWALAHLTVTAELRPFDLQVTVYRLAALAGLGALATYLGRQAAHHRRISDWAKAIATQLKSFPAFVARVSDQPESLKLLYENFSRRFLSSPPDSRGKNDTDDISSLVPVIVEHLLRRAPVS